jgi:protein TonB
MMPNVREPEVKEASGREVVERTLGKPDYKTHSLASGLWGDIARSTQPIRMVIAGEAQDTFLQGLLATPTDHPQHKPGDWLLSIVIHALVLGAIVLTPLYFMRTIDLRNFQLTYMVSPKLPSAAPPPLPPAAQEARPARTPPATRPGTLYAPRAIPRDVAIINEEAPPAISTGGVVGGLPGGEEGGVLSGLLGGTGRISPIAPPINQPTKSSARTIYKVGGQLKAPVELTRVEPIYPLIARNARMEGTSSSTQSLTKTAMSPRRTLSAAPRCFSHRHSPLSFSGSTSPLILTG